MWKKISVQLYALREECAAVFPEVLRELASIGYRGVQFAGFHGYDPALLKFVLAETGLRVSGLHYGGDEMLKDPERLISEAKMFDMPDIVCAGLGGGHQNRKDIGR
ncbi:hypothetical protein B1748_05020 [Paenibacillus sp. MY03]|jgi:sugar phosphate isomerase/epimerase|uniref:hypothetical protein n=1 Tax=Paenibacillus sp. MY03 TaxID=302980 RepID=UPI000B3C4A52|nr:hypothetical protein [Paenibacillus sp. MY03]OUS78126.1 hypothetical protein B1748_05020 [Paenibacillus sp. MY03]